MWWTIQQIIGICAAFVKVFKILRVSYPNIDRYLTYFPVLNKDINVLLTLPIYVNVIVSVSDQSVNAGDTSWFICGRSVDVGGLVTDCVEISECHHWNDKHDNNMNMTPTWTWQQHEHDNNMNMNNMNMNNMNMTTIWTS